MRVGLKVNVPLCCAWQAERMVQQWSRVPFQSYDGGCGTNLLGARPRSILILTRFAKPCHARIVPGWG